LGEIGIMWVVGLIAGLHVTKVDLKLHEAGTAR
jgi:hypothetical protein